MFGKMQAERLWSLANQGNHHLIEGPQEVELICQAVDLGLQLHLVHVGPIHILGQREGWSESKRRLLLS